MTAPELQRIVLQLDHVEYENLKSQFVTSSWGFHVKEDSVPYRVKRKRVRL